MPCIEAEIANGLGGEVNRSYIYLVNTGLVRPHINFSGFQDLFSMQLIIDVFRIFNFFD